jgi:hypothetical protein
MSIFPHHFPLETSQVGVGAGLEVLLVVGAVDLVGEEVGVVLVALLFVDVMGLEVEVGALVEVEDEDDEESLKERYQFERSVSPRHPPTVTPFQPLALMRS